VRKLQSEAKKLCWMQRLIRLRGFMYTCLCIQIEVESGVGLYIWLVGLYVYRLVSLYVYSFFRLYVYSF
jgi:hypothetical protein